LPTEAGPRAALLVELSELSNSFSCLLLQMAKRTDGRKDVLPPVEPSKASLFVEGPLGDLTILGLNGTGARFDQEDLWSYMEEVAVEVLKEFGIEAAPGEPEPDDEPSD
jgi:hypothetical protein